jgi:6-phosphogluconolactonase (cycloisomerase 2 family)
MPQSASAQTASGNVVLYASVGPALTQYDVDVEAAELFRRSTVTLPANVHYAWPHASGRHLYVASSNSASGMGPVGDKHHVTALRIDPASGALTPHGDPIPLPTRPIHMTTDIPSDHLLVAFSNPSAIRVYRVNRDATPGEEVRQPGPIDAGIYGHQVRVSPDNRLAILVTRGHDAAGSKPEDPGALKVFDYKNGLLTNEVSVAPNGGYGFGPRHLDFHPAKPWVYVSLERQNTLDMFEITGGALSPAPLFRKGTLAEPGNIRGRQVAGTVHVHPNGRFVYAVNAPPRRSRSRASPSLLVARIRSRSTASMRPPASRLSFSTSTREASTAEHFTLIRAVACWLLRTSWRSRSERAPRSVSYRRAWPCSG